MVIQIVFAYTKVIYDDINDIFKKNLYNSPLTIICLMDCCPGAVAVLAQESQDGDSYIRDQGCVGAFIRIQPPGCNTD